MLLTREVYDASLALSCVLLCVCLCVCVCVGLLLLVPPPNMCMFARTRSQMLPMRARAHTHTHTHAHTRTHTHTHTHRHMSVLDRDITGDQLSGEYCPSGTHGKRRIGQGDCSVRDARLLLFSILLLRVGDEHVRALVLGLFPELVELV